MHTSSVYSSLTHTEPSGDTPDIWQDGVDLASIWQRAEYAPSTQVAQIFANLKPITPEEYRELPSGVQENWIALAWKGRQAMALSAFAEFATDPNDPRFDALFEELESRIRPLGLNWDPALKRDVASLQRMAWVNLAVGVPVVGQVVAQKIAAGESPSENPPADTFIPSQRIDSLLNPPTLPNPLDGAFRRP